MASAYSSRRFMDDSSFRSAPGSPIGVLPDMSRPYGPYPLSGYAYNDPLTSDYFRPSIGSFRSAPGRAPLSYDPGLHAHHHMEDMIRRRNVEASTRNRTLHTFAPHHQIHPMMCSDGHYPNDFPDPQQLADFMCMDDHRLEQILSAYRITPHNLLQSWQNSMHMLPRPLLNRVALLEHLGAYPLAEHLFSRPPGLMARSAFVTRLPWH